MPQGYRATKGDNLLLPLRLSRAVKAQDQIAAYPQIF